MKQDETDMKMLAILQRAGRTRNIELAEAVGLSMPAVSERMRKMEESGVITGYYARLNPRLLGYDVAAFVVVTVDSSKHFSALVQHASTVAEIQECHAITGEGTHLLKVRTKNTTELEKLLAKIRSWQGVVSTMVNVVLSSSKESTCIRIHANGERTE